MPFKTIKASLIITWRMGRGFVNLIYGIWQLYKLPSAPISILAGSKLDINHPYISQAHEFAHKLINTNIPVLSSGCPGIMKIVNCQKQTHKKPVLTGLILSTPDKSKKSCCIIKNITLYRFFARKWVFLNYSAGFLVFPGGFGTMSELSQVLTLMQTDMRKKAPIILYSTEYWSYFIEWLDNAKKNNLITKEEAELFITTDDLNYAYKIIIDTYVNWQHTII